MRVLLWHVHGSWTTAFVHGPHDYVVPVVPGRGPDGLGRARTWDWPSTVVERTPAQLRDEELDAVIVQRPHELQSLVYEWTGRRPGADLPCVYVEHNTPDRSPYASRHAAADRADVLLVHVTHFNRMYWDNGRCSTRVIEHGVVDPGYRYSGELPKAVVVVNDPMRRGRATGTDLVHHFRHAVTVDLFGMRSEPLGGRDVSQARLHAEMARRRVYLHTCRWTSLGLTLIEAMHLGLPVVAVAATEAPEAVPADAGVVSNRIDVLTSTLQRLVADVDEARERGRAARRAALDRFGLKRFLADWDEVLEEVTR